MCAQMKVGGLCRGQGFQSPSLNICGELTLWVPCLASRPVFSLALTADQRFFQALHLLPIKIPCPQRNCRELSTDVHRELLRLVAFPKLRTHIQRSLRGGRLCAWVGCEREGYEGKQFISKRTSWAGCGGAHLWSKQLGRLRQEDRNSKPASTT